MPQPFGNNEIVELAASTQFINAHPRATELVVRDIVKAMKYIEACKPQAIALLATKMEIPNAQKVLETALPRLNITDPNLNVPSAVQWIELESERPEARRTARQNQPAGILDEHQRLKVPQKSGGFEHLDASALRGLVWCFEY